MERHYPEFLAALAERDRYLPGYVQEEFEAYLKCGRLEHGFLRVRCTTCHTERLVAFSCKRRGFCPSCGARRMTESAALLVDAVLPREPIRQWVLSVPFPLRFLFAAEPSAMGDVLALVYRALASHLIKKAGLTLTTGQTGAVTLIQRFGSALNLNIHFHMLCLDGAYTLANGRPHFRRVPPPSEAELHAILTVITARLARHLERRGLLVRDAESSHLTRAPGEDAALEILQGHSITYRIALGPHEGRKAFTLQTVPASERTTKPFLATHAGFSLHAGVAVRGGDQKPWSACAATSPARHWPRAGCPSRPRKVELEDPLQPLRPAHRPVLLCRTLMGSSRFAATPPRRGDLRPECAVRCEHPVEVYKTVAVPRKYADWSLGITRDEGFTRILCENATRWVIGAGSCPSEVGYSC